MFTSWTFTHTRVTAHTDGCPPESSTYERGGPGGATPFHVRLVPYFSIWVTSRAAPVEAEVAIAA